MQNFHSSREHTVSDSRIFQGGTVSILCGYSICGYDGFGAQGGFGVPWHFVHCGKCSFAVYEAQGGGDVEGIVNNFSIAPALRQERKEIQDESPSPSQKGWRIGTPAASNWFFQTGVFHLGVEWREYWGK